MILMIPLALERSGFGVISGIKATAGLRYIIANKTTIAIITMTPTKLLCVKNKGINGNNAQHTIVPTAIYGILLPNLVLVLSESAPNIGKRIKAAKLSIAIIIPTRYCTFLSSAMFNLVLNNSVSIGVHHESYTCHKSKIPKKAKPIIKVRL